MFDGNLIERCPAHQHHMGRVAIDQMLREMESKGACSGQQISSITLKWRLLLEVCPCQRLQARYQPLPAAIGNFSVRISCLKFCKQDVEATSIFQFHVQMTR